jgi:hypothetical protein
MSMVKDPHDLKNLFDRRFGKAFRECDRTDVALQGRDLQDCATGKALDLALVVVIRVGQIHLEPA